MNEMTVELEELLVCASLDLEDRDCVEQALDEGYAALPAEQKSRIRRLLNQQAANPGIPVLQRYRMRRAEAARLSRNRRRNRVQLITQLH